LCDPTQAKTGLEWVPFQRSAISDQRSAISDQRSGKAVLRLRAPAAEGGIEFFAGFDRFGDESNRPALERTQDHSSLLFVAGAKVNLVEVRQIEQAGVAAFSR